MEETSKNYGSGIVIKKELLEKELKNIFDVKKELEAILNREVTDILSVILEGAIKLDVSDIHFEPQKSKVRLRFRLDGVLQEILYFEKESYEKILSRIKLLSEMKLNVSQPQDGRFSVNMGEITIEVRTSTLPTEWGESVVMRILNPRSLISLEELGLRQELLKTFNEEIRKPNGMIIVTGPTASGKTTTLYAILKKIQRPEIKIITIEDPIEYHLDGIVQTQVNPKEGYTFATGLKSILRQSPNVVLVGEIRDFETAQIAIQASLTGHLVLTTMHTNDAAGTIARFLVLGERLQNIAPAINMAVAQRLVRKVCKKCSIEIELTQQELNKIKNVLKNINIEIKEKFKVKKAKGCEDCSFTGYKGRIGIFETLLVDKEMENFILTGPSISDLREMAQKKGMVTMYQDGLLKVIDGITTLEEIERVVAK